MAEMYEFSGSASSSIFLSLLSHGKRAAMMTVLVAAAMLLTGCSGEKTQESNDVKEKVVISEVMSTNSYYAPLEDGSCYDWVEFHNVSEESVNLKGCLL